MLKGEQDLNNYLNQINQEKMSPSRKQKAQDELLAEFENLQSGINLKDYV
jgi:hypothetical protein